MSIGITIKFMDDLGLIAREAGAAIMKIYETDFSVYEKSDSSPVTEADRKAEEIITHLINKRLTAKWPIVGEEAAEAGNTPDITGTPFWLVDPLDGTKEFIKKGTDFTVNIALIEFGRPIAGVVYVPVTDTMYSGFQVGSFKRVGNETPKQIHCREVPDEGMTAVVSKSHRTPETDDILKQFKIAEEVSFGSSLKLCAVAEGSADLYPRMGPTMEWDTAAGHAVLRYAGGELTGIEGEPFNYGKVSEKFLNPFFIAKAAAPEAEETETPESDDAGDNGADGAGE